MSSQAEAIRNPAFPGGEMGDLEQNDLVQVPCGAPRELQLVVYNSGKGLSKHPSWKRGRRASPPSAAGEPGGPGQAVGPVPARLAGRAGGACFRPGLVPPAHSSWLRDRQAGQDPGWPRLRPGTLALDSARPHRGNGAAAPPPGGAGSFVPHSGKLPPRRPAAGLGQHPRRAPWPRPATSGSPPCPVAAALRPARRASGRPFNPPPSLAGPPPSARTPTLRPGLQLGNVIRWLPET